MKREQLINQDTKHIKKYAKEKEDKLQMKKEKEK